jgi:hypothetical protein
MPSCRNLSGTTTYVHFSEEKKGHAAPSHSLDFPSRDSAKELEVIAIREKRPGAGLRVKNNLFQLSAECKVVLFRLSK